MNKSQQLRENLKILIRRVLTEDFDLDIAALTKRRDSFDYEIEKLKLKKAEESLKTAQAQLDHIKAAHPTGADGEGDAAAHQVESAKREVSVAKKRVAVANTKRTI